MTSSKKRTYMAVMSLGAAALFVDRCVLTEGTPAPASAGEARRGADLESGDGTASLGRNGRGPQTATAPPSGSLSPDPHTLPSPGGGESGLRKSPMLNSQTGSAQQPMAAEAISVPELPFPRNLKPVEPTAAMRDIFARPISAATATANEDDGDGMGGSPKTGEKRPMGRATFMTEHRLEAVMINEGLRVAIVNGQWKQIGDCLDGCTLLDITGESAVFHCPDGDALLSPFVRMPRKAP